jgi:hypothetical protein
VDFGRRGRYVGETAGRDGLAGEGRGLKSRLAGVAMADGALAYRATP